MKESKQLLCFDRKKKETEHHHHTVYQGAGASVIKIKMNNFRKRIRDRKGNAVGPSDGGKGNNDDDEGFCDDDDDKGPVTARDVRVMSPFEDPNELKRTTPPPSKPPIMSKMARDPSSFDLEMGNTDDDLLGNGNDDQVQNESETGKPQGGANPGNAGSNPGAGNGSQQGSGDGMGGDFPEAYPGTGPDFTMLHSGDGFF